MSVVPELPSGWSATNLGDVLEILDRLRVPINAKERAQRKGDVPDYGATGQVGWIDDHLFDEPLVLLGEDGAPFLRPGPKAYVVRGRSWVNNHAHVLRVPLGTPPEFWKHQLDQVAYGDFVTGTTRLKLSQAPMRRLPLFVPPASEQQRIASALGSYFSRLDDATATLKRVQANLKRYRASVLKAAVEGRHVPTEAALAKAEGRDYEPASVLLERILKERRAKWEEAELAKMVAKGKPPKNDKWKAKYKEPVAPDTDGLPELPEGWCWTALGQLADRVTKGSTPTSSGFNYVQGGAVRFVRVESLRDRLVDHRVPSVFIDTTAHAALARSQLEPGDLLYSIAGTLGRVAVVRTMDIPANTNQALAIIRGASRRVLAMYLVAALESDHGQRVARDKGRGGAMKNLSLGDINAVCVPLAPTTEQARIVTATDRMLSLADDAQDGLIAALARCDRLRQSILKCAFEGKLVDQDPNDEPASVLLDRIKAERAAAEAAKPKNRAKRKKKANS